MPMLDTGPSQSTQREVAPKRDGDNPTASKIVAAPAKNVGANRVNPRSVDKAEAEWSKVNGTDDAAIDVDRPMGWVERAAEAASSLTSNIVASVSEKWDAAGARLGELRKTVDSVLEDPVGSIKSAASAAYNTLVAKPVAALTSAVTYVKDSLVTFATETVPQFFTETIPSAIKTLANAVSNFSLDSIRSAFSSSESNTSILGSANTESIYATDTATGMSFRHLMDQITEGLAEQKSYIESLIVGLQPEESFYAVPGSADGMTDLGSREAVEQQRTKEIEAQQLALSLPDIPVGDDDINIITREDLVRELTRSGNSMQDLLGTSKANEILNAVITRKFGKDEPEDMFAKDEELDPSKLA